MLLRTKTWRKSRKNRHPSQNFLLIFKFNLCHSAMLPTDAVGYHPHDYNDWKTSQETRMQVIPQVCMTAFLGCLIPIGQILIPCCEPPKKQEYCCCPCLKRRKRRSPRDLALFIPNSILGIDPEQLAPNQLQGLPPFYGCCPCPNQPQNILSSLLNPQKFFAVSKWSFFPN